MSFWKEDRGSADLFGSGVLSQAGSVGGTSVKSSDPYFEVSDKLRKLGSLKDDFRVPRTTKVYGSSSTQVPVQKYISDVMGRIGEKQQLDFNGSESRKGLGNSLANSKYMEGIKGSNQILLSNSASWRQSPERESKSGLFKKKEEEMKGIPGRLAVLNHQKRISEIQSKIMSPFQVSGESYALEKGNGGASSAQIAKGTKMPFRWIEEDEQGLHLVGGGPPVFQSIFGLQSTYSEKVPTPKGDSANIPSQRRDIKGLLEQSRLGEGVPKPKTQNSFERNSQKLLKGSERTVDLFETLEEMKPGRNSRQVGREADLEKERERAIQDEVEKLKEENRKLKEFLELKQKENSLEGVSVSEEREGNGERKSSGSNSKREEEEMSRMVKEAVELAIERERKAMNENMEKELLKAKEDFQRVLREKEKEIQELKIILNDLNQKANDEETSPNQNQAGMSPEGKPEESPEGKPEESSA